jgi:hypothetical protein
MSCQFGHGPSRRPVLIRAQRPTASHRRRFTGLVAEELDQRFMA